jgi:diphosphomevalonate decarboxylase
VTAVTGAGRLPARATAEAPANIAFVKYWGARDLARAIPVNPSISMTLSRCVSRTTVDFVPRPGEDEVWLGRWEERGSWTDPGDAFRRRVLAHLAELRRRHGFAAGAGRCRVVTENSFPAAAGLASSASGFAALAVAAAAVLRPASAAPPEPAELSVLARASGSGSAARSVMGGYVGWPAPGGDPDDPPAVQLHPASHWPLCDVIAVVEAGAKEVPSLAGHRLAATSPYFERRLEELPRRLDAVRRALADRDLAALGPVLEEEAIDLHLIAMSCRPPVFYWAPATLAVLAAVRALRADGAGAWCTMDAGANVHVVTAPDDEAAVAARLEAVEGVSSVIRDRVGDGPTVDVERPEQIGNGGAG